MCQKIVKHANKVSFYKNNNQLIIDLHLSLHIYINQNPNNTFRNIKYKNKNTSVRYQLLGGKRIKQQLFVETYSGNYPNISVFSWNTFTGNLNIFAKYFTTLIKSIMIKKQ